MKKRFNSVLIIMVVFFIICTGCNLSANEMCPYIIKGGYTSKENNDSYEEGALECVFVNLSEKTVNEFIVVFYMFDKTGMPVSKISNNVTASVKAVIKNKEYLPAVISLDEIIDEKDKDSYYIDYLYVSKIIYEDGSTWSDPLGIKSFL